MPAEVIDDSNSVVDVTGAGAGHDVFLQRRFPTVPNLPLPQQMPSSEHHRQDGPPQKRDGLTDELVHSDRRPDRRGQPQQPRRDTQPPSRPRGEQCGRTCEKGETGDGSRQFSQPINRCTHWCLLNLRPSCQRNLRAARDQPPRRATHLVPSPGDPSVGATTAPQVCGLPGRRRLCCVFPECGHRRCTAFAYRSSRRESGS